MTLKIATWGAQGLPRWLHVIQEARTKHQDSGLAAAVVQVQGEGKIGSKNTSWTTISNTTTRTQA
eukprot:2729112-Prorocentrum_lima.AAC.1